MTDGVARHESAALLMLLAERYPEACLSQAVDDAGRGVWLEEMIFLANTLLPAFRDWFYADKDGDPAGADWVRNLARKRIETTWDRLEAMLSDGRAYSLGAGISTADFLTFMLMRCSRHAEISVELATSRQLCRKAEGTPFLCRNLSARGNRGLAMTTPTDINVCLQGLAS